MSTESLMRISGVLLSEEKLDAILELVGSLTLRTLEPADGVSVAVIRDGRFDSAVHTNELTRRVDGWQYAHSEGPSFEAIEEQRMIYARDLCAEGRWPQFGKMAAGEGVRAVLALPLLPLGDPIGALNIYAATADPFSDADVGTATMFAEQAAIVIANSVAYSTAIMKNGHLNAALESRELIGQAKGILMEREHCSAERAFDILRDVSQRANRKLRDVAQDVVDSAPRG
jgi:GAF domain-containing protein